MEIATAGLPAASGPGQDRYASAEDLVMVLDGATAFDPTTADASVYVDTLAEQIIAALADQPTRDLADGLSSAIAATADLLAISPGAAPSSTVALLRSRGDVLDLLVLGDSAIRIATAEAVDCLTDDRLASVAPTVRTAYQERLSTDHGFDNEHRALLSELQRHQAQARNTTNGYWIAEAEPAAAAHAVIRSYPLDGVEWCILSTDGAHRPIEHLGINWTDVAKLDNNGLYRLLMDLHRWEAETDPGGQQLPRSKTHDDKMLAVVRFRRRAFGQNETRATRGQNHS